MRYVLRTVVCAFSLSLLACGSHSSGSGDGGVGDGGNDSDALVNDGGADQDAAPGCDSFECPSDQHCVAGANGPECVNNTCADLNCTATEECQTTSGGGAECVDISCTSDIECPIDRFCNGTICVDDVCAQGTTRCVGQDLW